MPIALPRLNEIFSDDDHAERERRVRQGDKSGGLEQAPTARHRSLASCPLRLPLRHPVRLLHLPPAALLRHPVQGAEPFSPVHEGDGGDTHLQPHRVQVRATAQARHCLRRAVRRDEEGFCAQDVRLPGGEEGVLEI